MDIIGEEHQFSMISKTVHKVSTKPPKGGFFMYYINVEAKSSTAVTPFGSFRVGGDRKLPLFTRFN